MVGTHGRGIYIANMGAAEEFSDSLLGAPVHLFDVAPAYQFRWHHTLPSSGSAPFMGQNPPRGAVISYYIKEPQPEGVKLVITRATGDTVRTITGSGVPGLQRVTWDLSSQRPRPRALGEPTDRAELVRVPPGTYTVHLTMGDKKLERTIVVTELGPDKLGRVR